MTKPNIVCTYVVCNELTYRPSIQNGISYVQSLGKLRKWSSKVLIFLANHDREKAGNRNFKRKQGALVLCEVIQDHYVIIRQERVGRYIGNDDSSLLGCLRLSILSIQIFLFQIARLHFSPFSAFSST